ncbi:magnesium transporter [Pseudodesulfovibrio senegalensis]|jgi:magnesium transporter|uniref:Magnesium transporter MgtE n=1 Tax=Pseudodesulfovibrio senegalensis TaxID=1721087 RepID=A0A6N6N078_9BACT|nr:magnesium transporter [Pseudodesulfovibrio senegalensis]KAB1441117.1 magnesium transporter [Pseudodesulfovibrio senegalensis]
MKAKEQGMPQLFEVQDDDRDERELEQHPADAAQHIEGLDISDQVKFVKQLPVKDAAASIAEMDSHDQVELVGALNAGFGARILEQMAPDDATDLLEQLEENQRKALLSNIKAEDRAELKTLLTFDPDTAGGVMNTEALILDQHLSADEAVQTIRQEVEDKEIPYYAYLVDDRDSLTGVVSLRDLLLARRGAQLKDLVKTQNLITVSYNIDKEEVARKIAHYNLLALPVVDFGNRLLGVVTVDDVIDIIHEEATEDMQTMVGAGADETTDSPVNFSVRKRLPWLIINVINSAIAAYVVHLFEPTISKMAILAALMHIVSNQAGNTGQQALAVMIRQLAVEKFDRRKAWIAVVRELKIGIVNGVMISLGVFLLLLVTTQDIRLASCMGIALIFDMLVGALFGASIPLILKEIGRDPAQASSIFLTTITDAFGFWSFLALAGWMLLG